MWKKFDWDEKIVNIKNKMSELNILPMEEAREVYSLEDIQTEQQEI